jgi:apolipoprotein N-acyltransferase
MQKLIWRFFLPICALTITVWMGVEMVERNRHEMLWGWRPFFMMIGGWICILSLIRGFSGSTQQNNRLLLSSLSGILLSLGFPSSPLTPFMFVGLVPLLLVEESLRTQYGKAVRWKMFKYAFNAFFIWNVCTTWWVINTSFLPGIFANTMNAVFMAIVFMLIHQARSVLPEKVHGIVLVALWIAFEYLYISTELSWPWLTFGNSLAQYPSCVQWYEYTGVFGGSLWILFGNYWIYRWYTTGRKFNRSLLWIALWILGPVIWSLVMYTTIDLPEGDVEIVVVQPNFEPHYEKFTITQRDQLARFLDLSRSMLTDSTDYLVFPETSFDQMRLNDIENDYRIVELRKLLVEYPNLYIVTGIESYRLHEQKVDLRSIREMQDRIGNSIYFDVQNSAIQIADGHPLDVYFKSRLVPGAEIFPYKDFLPFLKPLVDMLQGSVAGLTMQEDREVFHSPKASVAPVICYESVYGEYVSGYIHNGADIIFIVTNDGWWDDSPGHVQHLKIGALRAIEQRRPIARSANTGISCFINIRGDILQPTKYEEATAIAGKVAPGTGFTFYTRWGDIIARIAALLALLILAHVITKSIVKKRR